MIKFKLKVTLDTQVHHLETNTVELIAAERHFGLGSSSMFTEDDWHFEYVVFLAYKAMSYRQLFGGTFDEFIEKNPDIEMEEQGEAHPLEAEAASPALASPTPSIQESPIPTSNL